MSRDARADSSWSAPLERGASGTATWLIRWYMGRISGRYCPCEWPVKSRRLMHWCGRIDDAHARLDFRDTVAFWMEPVQTSGTSSSAVTISRFRYMRTRHNGTPAPEAPPESASDSDGGALP